MLDVVVSATFARQFRALPKATQKRVRAALDALREDPRTPRPGADIKPLAATSPPKHRIRVGTYRVVYAIEGATVKVLDVFTRGSGYKD